MVLSECGLWRGGALKRGGQKQIDFETENRVFFSGGVLRVDRYV